MAKNPYETNTPEWQLWENVKMSRQQALAFYADAERYNQKAAAANEKADLYEAALEKLK